MPLLAGVHFNVGRRSEDRNMRRLLRTTMIGCSDDGDDLERLTGNDGDERVRVRQSSLLLSSL